jgi:hypothetical protein
MRDGGLVAGHGPRLHLKVGQGGKTSEQASKQPRDPVTHGFPVPPLEPDASLGRSGHWAKDKVRVPHFGAVPGLCGPAMTDSVGVVCEWTPRGFGDPGADSRFRVEEAMVQQHG